MQGEIALTLVGVLTSVVAAFYYLKVIKYTYFMEVKEEIQVIATNLGLLMVTVVNMAFTMLFSALCSQKYFMVNYEARLATEV